MLFVAKTKCVMLLKLGEEFFNNVEIYSIFSASENSNKKNSKMRLYNLPPLKTVINTNIFQTSEDEQPTRIELVTSNDYGK